MKTKSPQILTHQLTFKIPTNILHHYFALADVTMELLSKYVIDGKVAIELESYKNIDISYKVIENYVKTLKKEDHQYLKCSVIGTYITFSFLRDVFNSEGVETTIYE